MRIIAFDYLRAAAILMVLLAHYAQGVGSTTWAALEFGGIANAIFFLLSGALLGLSWHNGGREPWPVRYLLYRVKKLYPIFGHCSKVSGNEVLI